MPHLKLQTNVARKIGLPHYSSLSAGCSIEAETEIGPLADPLLLRRTLRRLWRICQLEVDRELKRQQNRRPPAARQRQPDETSRTLPLHKPVGTSGRGQPPVPQHEEPLATAAQCSLLSRLADRLKIDLSDQLRRQYDVSSPAALARPTASRLIRELRTAIADVESNSSPAPPPASAQ